MKIKKFNQLFENDSQWADEEINKWEKDKKENTISRKKLDELGLSESDLKGGITEEEYNYVISFISELKNKNEDNIITDKEKVLSEILLQIVEHPFDRNLDFETTFHRRLGFIKNNKNKIISESIKRTYSEFLEDVMNELMNRGLTDEQADQYINYWHGKNLPYLWKDGYSPELAIEELKDSKGKITWLK